MYIGSFLPLMTLLSRYFHLFECIYFFIIVLYVLKVMISFIVFILWPSFRTLSKNLNLPLTKNEVFPVFIEPEAKILICPSFIYAEGRSKFLDHDLKEGHEMKTIMHMENKHGKINTVREMGILKTAPPHKTYSVSSMTKMVWCTNSSLQWGFRTRMTTNLVRQWRVMNQPHWGCLLWDKRLLRKTFLHI